MSNTTRSAIAIRDDSRAAGAQHKRRCQELLSLVHRRMADVTEGFYEIGVALTEIQNNRLYAAAGYDTLAALLKGEGLMSDVQAIKLMNVAALVPREAAVSLGAEKSYALTRFVKAHPEGHTVREYIDGEVLIQGKEVKLITVRELKEATRALHPPGNGAKRGSEQRALARQAQAALRKRGIADVQVIAVKSRGRWAYRLELDEDALRRIARV